MNRRTSRRLRTVLCALAATFSVFLTSFMIAPAAGAADLDCVNTSVTTVQKQILSEVNTARKSAGLSALKQVTGIDTVALKWSASMAKANTMSHSKTYSKQIPSGWTKAGENVGYGYSYGRITTEWMKSPGHKANILDKAFTHIGIGVACSTKGTPYYTQNFAAYRTDPAGTVTSVPRLAGTDTYATSAAVSAATFSSGVNVVYLASGENLADALSGAAMAGVKNAPVLLVGKNSISPAVKAELQRLKPKKIVILGGTVAISTKVANAAKSYTRGGVTRIAGANRYETSSQISKATFSAGVGVVYLANGTAFADALSGGSAAATTGGPVLLVKKDSIPASVAAELKRLKPKKIVILGGTSVVSAKAVKAASAYTGTVTRSAGANRYATSAAISKATFASGVSVVYLANGKSASEALSGSAAAGTVNAPVLLTNGSSLSNEVKAELKRLQPKKIVIVGSTGSVSSSVASSLTTFVKG